MAVMAGLGLFWTASWPPCTPAAVLKGDQTLQVSIPYFFILGKQKILITQCFCFHVDLNFVDTLLCFTEDVNKLKLFFTNVSIMLTLAVDTCSFFGPKKVIPGDLYHNHLHLHEADA